jgi:hypothetical protein
MPRTNLLRLRRRIALKVKVTKMATCPCFDNRQVLMDDFSPTNGAAKSSKAALAKDIV